MISMMREYARSLKIVLLIVVVVFILTSGVLFYFGSGPFGSGKSNAVAVVNGEEIPPERFKRAQANMMAAYARMARQQLTPELAERLGLSQQVINDLVTEAVVIQGAADEGVRVSDDELRVTIQQIREFQENGRFSRDEYLKVLRQIRLDPGEFETEVRRQLLRRKMENLIKQGVKVSDEELRQAYRQRHEQVRAAWAYGDVKPAMAAVQVADADLEPYVKTHQPQFSQPERRRLQYVLLAPSPQAATVSDAEVDAYYKEHGSEFDEPKRLRIAHVLVRVPPVGGSDAENAAKAKVEDVIKRARAGEDFGKLAREISEDKASAVQGGDLGFVGPGELVAPFEQAAFALKKGDVSDPVRTPFGYHAIRILDVRDGGKTPLKDVAPKIKAALVAQKSERAAQARADEAKAALLGAPDFAAAAKRLGLEAREATFGRGDALGEAGRDPQLDEAVFGLAVGGVSTPLKTAAGYAVVKVTQQIPAGVPPLRRDSRPRRRGHQARAGRAAGDRQGQGAGRDPRQGRRLRGGGQGGGIHHREHPAVLPLGSAEGARQPSRRRAPGRAADPGRAGRGAGARRGRRLRGQDAGAAAGQSRRLRPGARRAGQAGARAEAGARVGHLDPRPARVGQGRSGRPARLHDALTAGRLTMDKTALLIIDAQQEYFAPIGKVVLPDGPKAVVRIADTLRWARESRVPVFHIVHESRRPGATTFVPGSPALAIHDAVAPRAEEPIITKHLPGAFTDTPLEAELRRRGIERVIVSGFMTQMCCDTTSREAAHRGFKVTLLSDATAAMDVKGPDGVVIPHDQVHRTHLGSLNGFLAEVKRSDEVIGT